MKKYLLLVALLCGGVFAQTANSVLFIQYDNTLTPFADYPQGANTGEVFMWTSVGGGQFRWRPTLLATVAYSGAYADLTGKPTAGKRQETYSGATAGSGTYTVTFGTAYSVAPNIQPTATNMSSDNIFIRVTSITTTGFTILCRTRTDIAGLLPTFANTNGINIDVVITEK